MGLKRKSMSLSRRREIAGANALGPHHRSDILNRLSETIQPSKWVLAGGLLMTNFGAPIALAIALNSHGLWTDLARQNVQPF